jgi:hypothetical protein
MEDLEEKVLNETISLIPQVYTDLAQPTVKEVGNTVSRIVHNLLVPVRGLCWGIEKIEKCVNEGLEKRLANVKPEKLHTPEPEIAVPLLQALTYTAQNEILREMYLNLLASTMNSEKDNISHRAFVQIINQLSPMEARLLAAFRPKTNIIPRTGVSVNGGEFSWSPSEIYGFPEAIIPIVNYYLCNKSSQRRLLQKNVVLTQLNDDVVSMSVCIDNLLRLGLINVDFKNKVSDSDYNIFQEHEFYKRWNSSTTDTKGMTMNFVRGNIVIDGQYNNIFIEKGLVRLTQFGFNFMSVCVIESKVL